MGRDTYLADHRRGFENGPRGRGRFSARGAWFVSVVRSRRRNGRAAGLGLARRAIVQNKANFRPDGIPVSSFCGRRCGPRSPLGTSPKQSQFLPAGRKGLHCYGRRTRACNASARRSHRRACGAGDSAKQSQFPGGRDFAKFFLRWEIWHGMPTWDSRKTKPIPSCGRRGLCGCGRRAEAYNASQDDRQLCSPRWAFEERSIE